MIDFNQPVLELRPINPSFCRKWLYSYIDGLTDAEAAALAAELLRPRPLKIKRGTAARKTVENLDNQW